MDTFALFLQNGSWHMGEGWGWWMMFGWLWMVVFWGLVIWAVVYVARRFGGPTDRQPPDRSAIDILEERYARGELTDEEFENRRRRIIGGRQP